MLNIGNPSGDYIIASDEACRASIENGSLALLNAVNRYLADRNPVSDRWSRAEDELLARLWADGLSCSTIAEQLPHRSRNAVIGRVHRLGLQHRARSPQRKATNTRRAVPVYQSANPAQMPRDPCARCNVRGDLHDEHGCSAYRRSLVA